MSIMNELDVVLANGAKIEILHYDQTLGWGVVLAEFRGPHPYVTWRCRPSSNDVHVLDCEAGHYFSTRKEAYEDFQKRARYAS